MDATALLATLVFLAGVVNRIVEMMKPGFDELPVSPEWRSTIIRLVSVALGVLAVVGGGEELNLFALSEVYGTINPVFGLVMTGVIVGGFSNLLYSFGELLTRKPQQPEA